MRSLGWAAVDAGNFLTHWCTVDDGHLTCSCGWEVDPPEGMCEFYFRGHAQAEWIKLLIEHDKLRPSG